MTKVLTGSLFSSSVLVATTRDDYVIYGNTPYLPSGLFVDVSVDGTTSVVPFEISNSTFKLPDDLLVGGVRNDTMYGDIGLFNFLIDVTLNATNYGEITFTSIQVGSQFIMGNDVILAKAGNNVIFGDNDFTDPFGVIKVQFLAENHSSIIGSVIFTNVLQIYGNDKIIAGNGNNWITGDTGVMNISYNTSIVAQGDGTTVIFEQETLTCLAQYGNDLIIVGSGDNRIYGDAPNFSEPTTGYNTSANGLDAYGYSTNYKSDFTCKAGDDTINVGRGHNIIFGDFEVCELDTLGGLLTALNGAVVEAMAWDNNRHIVCGSDTIYGGAGNDVILADTVTSKLLVVDAFIVTDNSSSVTSTTKITDLLCEMGDDKVFAGAGNDIVATDSLRCISDYNGFVVSDYSSVLRLDGHLQLFEHDGGNNFNNSLILGNDTVSLGAGSDVLLECMYSIDNGTKMAWSGFDTILDFSKTNDKLVVDRVVDLNNDSVYDWKDLDEAATFTHQSGNTVIAFDGGGSLTLVNVNVNSFQDLNIEVHPQYEGYDLYVHPVTTIIV